MKRDKNGIPIPQTYHGHWLLSKESNVGVQLPQAQEYNREVAYLDFISWYK